MWLKIAAAGTNSCYRAGNVSGIIFSPVARDYDAASVHVAKDMLDIYMVEKPGLSTG